MFKYSEGVDLFGESCCPMFAGNLSYQITWRIFSVLLLLDLTQDVLRCTGNCRILSYIRYPHAYFWLVKPDVHFNLFSSLRASRRSWASYARSHRAIEGSRGETRETPGTGSSRGICLYGKNHTSWPSNLRVSQELSDNYHWIFSRSQATNFKKWKVHWAKMEHNTSIYSIFATRRFKHTQTMFGDRATGHPGHPPVPVTPSPCPLLPHALLAPKVCASGPSEKVAQL